MVAYAENMGYCDGGMPLDCDIRARCSSKACFARDWEVDLSPSCVEREEDEALPGLRG
jgi:hypothetical protein